VIIHFSEAFPASNNNQVLWKYYYRLLLNMDKMVDGGNVHEIESLHISSV
jgi:hypothetical protein